MPDRILPPYIVPLVDSKGIITQEWRAALNDVFDQLFNAGEQLLTQASQIGNIEQDLKSLEELVSSIQANQGNEILPTPSISDSPVGTILAYGANDPPMGFLECNGDDVSRVQYAELFNKIGETWGPGDGSSTFTLPDGRGRFFIGQDSGSSIGDYGGTAGSTDLEHLHAFTVPSVEVQSGTGAMVGQAGVFNTANALTGVTSDPPFFTGIWIIRY